jgi:hypothetical protein
MVDTNCAPELTDLESFAKGSHVPQVCLGDPVQGNIHVVGHFAHNAPCGLIHPGLQVVRLQPSTPLSEDIVFDSEYIHARVALFGTPFSQ